MTPRHDQSRYEFCVETAANELAGVINYIEEHEDAPTEAEAFADVIAKAYEYVAAEKAESAARYRRAIELQDQQHAAWLKAIAPALGRATPGPVPDPRNANGSSDKA